jgi:hypothetical protein
MAIRFDWDDANWNSARGRAPSPRGYGWRLLSAWLLSFLEMIGVFVVPALVGCGAVVMWGSVPLAALCAGLAFIAYIALVVTESPLLKVISFGLGLSIVYVILHLVWPTRI